VKNSIVNIESVSNHSFGTGFVIHHDKNGVYLLTCKHVLEDVVHPMVDDVVAKVVAEGDFIDMVVLFVSKLQIKAIPLQEECCHSLKVEVIGFSNFSKASLQKEHIDAILYKEHVELHSKEGVGVYKVRKIKAEDGFNFERGNSGSPVICKKTKRVIAMISNKEGSSLAYAVNIENLKEVWKDVPLELFSETMREPIDKVIVEKIEPLRNFSFPWKKVLMALVIPILLFIFYKILWQKEVWIDPEKKVCTTNGGVVDANGLCYANWRNAEKICLASKGVLPNIEMLKKELVDCGGIVENVELEESRSDALKCYKNKGFILYDAYWSSTSYNSDSALGINFGHPEKHLFYYSKSNYATTFQYVRCERLGD